MSIMLRSPHLTLIVALLIPFALPQCRTATPGPPPAGQGGDAGPASSCAEADCGPRPGMPSYTCADGTEGGFTGQCKPNADGGCGWEIIDCPRKDAPPPQPETKPGECPADATATGFTDCQAGQVFADGCCHPNFEAACAALGCELASCTMMKSNPPQAACNPRK